MSTGYIVSQDRRRSRAGRVGFALLAFLCGAAAVYALAFHRASHAPDQVAAAFIWQRTGGQSAASDAQPMPNAATIEEEVLSAASLDQASPPPGRTTPSSPTDGDAAPDQPTASQPGSPTWDRSNVRVQVDSNLRRGQSLIAIRVTDPDPEHAVCVANHLAEQYARRYRAATHADTGQDRLQAQRAAEQARQQYLAARQQLDRFLAAHFQQLSDAERPAASSAARDSQPPQETPPKVAPAGEPAPVVQETPAMVDNRLWLNLDRQRAEVVQRRNQLLVNRTPLHPDVQEMNSQIAALEQRLAQVPRRVAAPVPGQVAAARGAAPSDGNVAAGREGDRTAQPPPAGSPPHQVATLPPQSREGTAAPSAADAARARRSAAREYQTLHERLDQADKARDQAAEQERQTWQRPSGVSELEVQLADHAEPGSLLRQQAGMLALSLVAGLVVAAGTTMFSAGFSGREQPFSNPGQVETALSIPVVGAISGDGATQKDSQSLGPLFLRSLLRLVLLILLAGGIGMLVVMMNPQGVLVPN